MSRPTLLFPVAAHLRAVALGLVIAAAPVGAVLAGELAARPTADTKQAERIQLTRVEAKKVCMVNEQHFAKDQIPIIVEGRTYYGCCEMCKKALGQNADKRSAIDPISGKKVDKATATIGADPDGKVYYFETEANFEAYNKSAKPAPKPAS